MYCSTPGTEEDAEVVGGPLWGPQATVRAGVITPHLQQRHQQLAVLVRHRKYYNFPAIGVLFLKQEDIIPIALVMRIKLCNNY